METVSETKSPMISVIVPVYKVEKYLAACVDSILAQTYTDFELILVDDGSPDRCGEICDAYARQDPRIRVIHQKNGGLSAARNAGIDVARGEYLTFVDSDDLIDDRFLHFLYYTAERYHAELVTSWFVPFQDGTHPPKSPEPDPADVIIRNNREAVCVLYNGSDSVTVTACGKLFRASLIGDLRFPVGKLHEDQAVVPQFCYRANRVVTFQTPLYYYRNRQGSITSSSFSVRRYDDIETIEQCIRFFRNEKEDEIVRAAEAKRMRLICIYSIEAAYYGQKVPQEYQISKRRALRYIKNLVSNEKYEYCLSHANPTWFRLYLFRKRVIHGLHRLLHMS